MNDPDFKNVLYFYLFGVKKQNYRIAKIKKVNKEDEYDYDEQRSESGLIVQNSYFLLLDSVENEVESNESKAKKIERKLKDGLGSVEINCKY